MNSPCTRSFILTFPHYLFGAVSQRYLKCCLPTAVLILPPIIINLQFSRCTSFLADVYVYMCVCIYIHIYNGIYLYNGINNIYNYLGFPSGSDGKKSVCNVRDMGTKPWLGRFPWRRECLPTPVFLPGELHGQRSQWVIVHWITKSWT